MFFVLSKLLFFAISPTFWITFFLVASLTTRSRRYKKYFLRTSLILFIIFSNPLLLNLTARWWDAKETSLPPGQTYSSAIVMGGFASEDFHGHGYFNTTSDRFIQALKLKLNGTVSHILISGGNPSLLPTDFRESDWVTQQLEEFQVPDSVILNENRARNSFENAAYSRQILDSLHLRPPYVLITSAYHMKRATLVFKKMNIPVVPYPCNYIAGMGRTDLGDFIPSFGVLGTWEMYLKEFVGYWVYYFTR